MNVSLTMLSSLHTQVSQQAEPLAERFHSDTGHPRACGLGCTRCCQDDITVFEVEAALIRQHHDDLLATGQPHGAGACAMLDPQGACRVYEQRPYVCRTQGLPLRWLEPDGDGGGLEYRDICPLNESEAGIPLVELAPEQFWTIGSWESKLRMIQELTDGGEGRRVGLRSLFA